MSVDPINLLHLTLIFKWGFIALVVVYILFIFIVINQIVSMNKIVKEASFGSLLVVIAGLFFFLGIALLLVSLGIL